jgi:antitoxin (DNA-binding transcriptional repressor) of toxin-antitoxin stability system
MYHMRKATVRDLRYRFTAVEDLLRDGEEIQITKRKRVIAHLVPAKKPTAARRPDFLARLKKIYRGKRMAISGADLVLEGRGRF